MIRPKIADALSRLAYDVGLREMRALPARLRDIRDTERHEVGRELRQQVKRAVRKIREN